MSVHIFVRLIEQVFKGTRASRVITRKTDTKREFVTAHSLFIMLLQAFVQAITEYSGKGFRRVIYKGNKFISTDSGKNVSREIRPSLPF